MITFSLLGIENFVNFEIKCEVIYIKNITTNTFGAPWSSSLQHLWHFNGEEGQDKRGMFSPNVCLMTDRPCKLTLKCKASGFLYMSKVVKEY